MPGQCNIITDVCCCHPQLWVLRCLSQMCWTRGKHLYFVICRWVTNKDSLAPEDPCFFCDVCFRMLHYDVEGNKLGEFLAYPYVDPGIFNWNWHEPEWIQWTTLVNLLLWLLKPPDSLSFECIAGFWVRLLILYPEVEGALCTWNPSGVLFGVSKYDFNKLAWKNMLRNLLYFNQLHFLAVQ